MTTWQRWLVVIGLLTAGAGADDATQAESQRLARAARAHQDAHRYAAAERDYRRSIELWGDNDRALNNLAWMLLTADDEAARRPRAALPLAERAVALQPRSAGHLDTLATALDALGRHVEAARLELRVTRLDPKQAVFGETLRRFALRGLAEEAPRQPPAVRSELRALAVRGGLLAGLKPAALLRELDQAADATPPGAQSWAIRAELLRKLGRHQAAADAAARALQAGARDPGLHRLQGESLASLGRPAEAAQALEQAIASAPRDFGLRKRTAELWRQAQRPDGVARVVSAAVAVVESQGPLWTTKWEREVYALSAKAHEEAATRAPADRQRLHREALACWVRAEAARGDGAQRRSLQAALKRLAHPTLKLRAPARRAALAAEVLGQRDLPRFVDGSKRLAARGGRRVAFADVDGDGDPDLLLGATTLLLNDGRGTFAQAPDSGLRSGGRGGVFADVDRDGDLDLFVAGGGPDRLFRNESTGEAVRFVQAEVPGLDDKLPSEGAAWADVNGDGYPDLYVANYQKNAKQIDTGTPDRLWLSDGRGGLRPAHDSIKQAPPLCGRGVSPADFDQDGDVDVFVSNYRLQRNLLFVNDGGRLREVARERGLRGDQVRGAYGHTIGSAWGDLDGDGDLDLVCANLAHPRFIEFSEATNVYLQQPDGRFVPAPGRAGIRFEETHSHPLLWDFDNDGDLDLTLTSVYGGRPSATYRNRLIEDGVLRFEDVTWGTSTRVFNGWGGAVADVDNDGDLDAAVAAAGGVHLWLNQGTAGRSVRVRLRGARGDTWGAYATATLEVGGRRLVRQLALGSGTTCQDEPILHFGVGREPGPFTLRVRWPGGGETTCEVGLGLQEVVEGE